MTRAGALAELSAALHRPGVQVVSSDVFDTLLLRDASTQTWRLAEGARRAASRLGVSAADLVELRWSVHDSAYRAVQVEGGDGDAGLPAMSAVTALAAGLGEGGVQVLRTAECEVDAEHLRPHTELLGVLDRARAAGRRVVAVSDTWYSADDVAVLFHAVLGRVPVDHVYTSADLGVTKHAGGVFAVVGECEGVPPEAFLHVGDDHRADVGQARAAGWQAVHLPRVPAPRAVRIGGGLRSLPDWLRRRR